MAVAKSPPLGLALVEQGYLSQAQLIDALAEQRRTGRILGQVLVENNFVTEEHMARTIALQQGIPFIDLRQYDVVPAVVQVLSEVQARRFRAIVLEDQGDSYLVGFTDPSNLRAQDELSAALGRPIYICVITPEQFSSTVDRIYRKTAQLGEYANDVKRDIERDDSVIDIASMASSIDDVEAPVVRLLQSIFEEAVSMQASDIHIEPQEKRIVVRFRIDGTLHTQFEADSKIASALMVRLKLLAGMDIAERRLPQDGRITVQTESKQTDIRLSTIPTQFGESAVMRLLSRKQGSIDLKHLGMQPELLSKFNKLIRAPHGILLVTGPTGSGKSSTLYGALEILNQPKSKILTIEDPVEYRIEGINQVQVNEKIDLTFSTMLRAFLRQDPDIILVGEIRDEETAQIATRAAMTGHLVLSTLHTNDAASTPSRLLDMGIPPYLIASTLLGIVSQRLVRLICTYCSGPYQPSSEEEEWMERLLGEPLVKSGLRHGAGCTRCNGIGFHGRTGVFELLEMTPKLTAALHKSGHEHLEKTLRDQMGSDNIQRQVLNLVNSGQTTIAEAMNVVTSISNETAQG